MEVKEAIQDPFGSSHVKSDSADLRTASSASGNDTLVAAEARILSASAAFTRLNLSQDIPDDAPPLEKPVLIPRLAQGITAPLVRAWPPELARRGVTQHDFMLFLDNLNIISSPTAATTILTLAAFGIGFVPWDGAEGLATLTELAAVGVGYRIVVARYTRFLRAANESYFHPRRLHARLVQTGRMKKALGIPADDPLVAPLEESTLDMTAHERCMEGLKPYCCQLSYDLPDPEPQTQLLAKLAAWTCEQDRKKVDRCAKSSRKKAWKKHQAGKKLKREGYEERARAKKLQWLVIQDLEDWHKEEEERVQLAAQDKAKKYSLFTRMRAKAVEKPPPLEDQPPSNGTTKSEHEPVNSADRL
ncbi:hypothetical protein S7711_00616 [Stachybotrys chartarum IBT 7711]|uniref:Uncharacterized protein n=1 Tax=Stachybotrys chartarum (strain CBS 109288 / IBT 7711) TaxID=1280523 RepID=A0A084ATW6_STACB|nr:hypothetical protein S7711_00616 [Stachybotrys chartarum IBT 7711]